MKLKKRYALSLILIILVVFCSIYYVFMGKNEIERTIERNRIIINQRIRNIELDRFPTRLQLDFEANQRK
jgi:CHASE3 domain sensor protein